MESLEIHKKKKKRQDNCVTLIIPWTPKNTHHYKIKQKEHQRKLSAVVQHSKPDLAAILRCQAAPGSSCTRRFRRNTQSETDSLDTQAKELNDPSILRL